MVDLIRGWVIRKREHGRIVFLDLRTVEFPGRILQVVFKEDVCGKEILERAKRTPLESSVVVKGELKENPKAPDGIELLAREMEVIQESQEFPLGPKEHGVEAIMKYRHLAVRLPKYQKIWIVRERILKYFREWFDKNGWHEVSPPIIVKAACEGGATLFKLDWFGDVAYLSQSAQLYLEAMIFSLGKVWSLTPSFRAEKSRTRRHLSEYWHLEWEAAFYKHEDLIRDEEKMIKYVIKKLLEDEESRRIIEKFRGEDIRILEKSVEEKWPRIKYDEIIDILQKKGFEIKWGDDLGADEERVLTMEFETPIFATHYPKEVKAFYMKWSPDGRTVENHDLLMPEGYGEVVGGSERETDIEKMKEMLRIQEGITDFKDYEWYFDLRRYGSIPHSGAGLGIERFLMWVLKLDHIRDAIPFPRMAREKEFI